MGKQVTFGAYEDGTGGIPIPLTTETLLNAMSKVCIEAEYTERTHRQYLAFRGRFLWMLENTEFAY